MPTKANIGYPIRPKTTNIGCISHSIAIKPKGAIMIPSTIDKNIIPIS